MRQFGSGHIKYVFWALLMLLANVFHAIAADNYYVLYYEDGSGSRRYVGIDDAGTSLMTPTDFSARCIWVATSELSVARGGDGSVSSDDHTYNQGNRVALQSYLNADKFLGADITSDNAKKGTPVPFSFVTSGNSKRWLTDGQGHPIIYTYNYKHFLYYDDDWLFSSVADEYASRAKLERLTPARIAISKIEDDGVTVVLSSKWADRIYYTTDGSTPTSSSTLYTDTFKVKEGNSLKVCFSCGANVLPLISEMTLPSQMNLVVSLDDREDHTWNYYQEDSPISSPHPRNVKITYHGGGIDDAGLGNAVATVGVDAFETSFVYQQTLESEKQGETYTYPYTTIPNPFSRRPSKQESATDAKTYYGFKSWKVKSISSGCSITDANGTVYAVDSVIPAEAKVYFAFTNDYAVNTLSAQVELEAVWAEASVLFCHVENIKAALSSDALQQDSYERNFIVVNEGAGESLRSTISNASQKALTITGVEPDGSADYREIPTSVAIDGRYLYNSIKLYNTLKLEYIFMRNGGRAVKIDANANNLILGCGIDHPSNPLGNLYTCADEIIGQASGQGTISGNLDYQLRIESGIYNDVVFASYGGSTSTPKIYSGNSKHIRVIMGCDYDRSINEDNKLQISTSVQMGHYAQYTNNTFDNASLYVVTKSGRFITKDDFSAGNASESFYISLYSNPTDVGKRTLIVEGGVFANIGGGVDSNNNLIGNSENGYDKTSVYIRMKGGNVKGAIYGGGAYAETYGNRRMIFTGGTVGGWIAAGCNGTQSGGGRTFGKSQVYIGGDIDVNNTKTINKAAGGQVFGAGKGYESSTGTSGAIMYGSTVVIADQAELAGNVYGGGYYGYAAGFPSNVFVYGGTIDGSVFGGSNMKGGTPTNITMTDGVVKGGIYGGSNSEGNIEGNVTMHINGGTIGTEASPVNIHGGGYGSGTSVSGNIDLTIGAAGSDRGATIYGDVYGGSALGDVNSDASNSTRVTLNVGTIHGDLYGGGLGNADHEAKVNGAVLLTVNGGCVNGSVFGCNNANGAPQSTVEININHVGAPLEGKSYSIDAVIGGGNQASYTYEGATSSPMVNINGGSVESVFGAGFGVVDDDAKALVSGNPMVNMTGGLVGRVFGGGNYGNVIGNTHVRITGGNVRHNVYGGGNQANVTGQTNVVIGQ